MSDLIRRSAVIDAIRGEREYLIARKQLNAEHVLAHHFDAIMDSIPAVDAVEVRHGKWMFDGEDWFCNRCGHNALCEKDTGEQVLSIVCPNCCVRMDG